MPMIRPTTVRIRPAIALPLPLTFLLATPMIEKISPKSAKPQNKKGIKQKTSVKIPNTRPAVAAPLLRFAGAAATGATVTGCV